MLNQTTLGLFKIIALAFDLINRIAPLIVSLTVVVFIWGVFKYVTAAGDSDARQEARGYMTWGIVSLFVMVSVWGLVNLLVATFRLDNTMPPLPAIPTISAVSSTDTAA
ncbi:MAG TPA: hypothetical protein VGE62_00260 [Candidatus Paceibacterota bacterium]